MKLALYVFIMSIPFVFGNIYVPNMDNRQFVMDGDIMIGAVVPVHHCIGECSDIHLSMFQAAGAIADSINVINADKSLLPNIQLGVRILDDRLNSTVSLARVVQMLPRKYIRGGNRPTADVGGEKDVVGVFGGITSDSCLVMARFLQLFNLPLLSARCTNDRLSEFPNFLRLVPPDKYQVQIMLDIMAYYNWTYVSFVYVDNAYGRNALKQMQELTHKNGLCLAVTEGVPFHPTQQDIEHTVKTLKKNSKARVIVSFLYSSQVLQLIDGWNVEQSNEKFLWLFSDSLQVPMTPQVSEVLLGSIFLSFDLGAQGSDYDARFAQKTVQDFKSDGNPWWRKYWKEMFGCDCDVDCDPRICDGSTRVGDSAKYARYEMNPIFTDGVRVYAQALHNLITKYCPEAFRDHRSIHPCITSKRLLTELYQVSMNGTMGYIQFDSHGDYMGGYNIIQLQRNQSGYRKEIVGRWARTSENTSKLEMSSHEMVDFSMFETAMTIKERIAKVTELISIPRGLISVCSLPCRAGEIKVILDLRCCWECHRCNENEYLGANRTKCLRCPPKTWPNQDSFDRCEPILPSYLLWNEPFGLVLTAFTVLGLFATLWVAYVFIRHRNVRVIRASGRELSMVILTGVLLSYLTVAVILSGPGKCRCYIQRICYHLSYTIVYAPLLIKTNWIYRLFNVVKKGQTKPKLASANTQLLFTCIQIIPQVSYAFFSAWLSF